MAPAHPIDLELVELPPTALQAWLHILRRHCPRLLVPADPARAPRILSAAGTTSRLLDGGELELLSTTAEGDQLFLVVGAGQWHWR